MNRRILYMHIILCMDTVNITLEYKVKKLLLLDCLLQNVADCKALQQQFLHIKKRKIIVTTIMPILFIHKDIPKRHSRNKITQIFYISYLQSKILIKFIEVLFFIYQCVDAKLSLNVQLNCHKTQKSGTTVTFSL